MHFKNGREARLGDQVVYRSWDGNVKAGILTCANGRSTTWDGEVKPALGGQQECKTIGEMYHVEDAFVALDAPAKPVELPSTSAAEKPGTDSGEPAHAFMPAATLGQAAALLILCLLLALGLNARAGYDNGTFTNAISASGVISNLTSTAASQAFPLHPGCPLMVFPRFNGTGTTNIAFGFDLYSGGNWSTTQPLIVSNNCAGLSGSGTNVVGCFTFTAAQLAGASQIRWDYTQTTDFTNIAVQGVDYQQLY